MAPRSKNTLHLVGFGSQARAWAQCLRASGWSTPTYLSRLEGPSAKAARELGFEEVMPLSALSRLPEQPEQSDTPALVAMLCPDTVIAPVYQEHLANLKTPLTLVLAHGYAVYANELKPSQPSHELALFAPKAIGPKVWSLFQEANGNTHRLVAGFHAPSSHAPALEAMARAMGFARENLVPATFEQEAIGDLLSEQGLLCGGVFTLLEWTLKAMSEAGVPTRLIREECLTELELIAGLLRERGPETTFRTISQAAQCGTVLMQQSLNDSNAREHFEARLAEVLDHRFAETFRSGRWTKDADTLASRLGRWQREFSK